MGRFTRTRVAVSAGVLVAGVWGSSMALFTDSQAENASFSSGTLDLAASPSPTLLNVTNMAPGDVVYAPLSLTNNGTLDLRWSMTSADGGGSDSGFLGALAFAVVQNATCDATAFGGAPLATGAVPTLAIGDPTAGAQPGDQTLAPSATSDLCFRVTFPTSADNTLQAKTASATLTFAAEQVKNNP